MGTQNNKNNLSRASYVASLKTIWHHTSLVYKNFIHWNYSKTCIYLKTFFIAFILNIPVLLVIAGVFTYMQNSLTEKEMNDLFSGGIESILFLQNHIGTAVFIAILLLISFSLLIVALSYSWYLFGELSQKYAVGEEISYLKKGWWKWENIISFVRDESKKFIRFTRVFLWISLWISIPGLIAFFLYLGLFGATEMGLLNKENIFDMQILGYGSFLAAGIFLVGTLYFLIRYMYAPLLLLEKEHADKNGREISKLSWELTRKKVHIIFLTLLPFFLILGMLKFPTIFTEQEIKVERISFYLKEAQKNNPETYENDHTYIQTQLLSFESLNEQDFSEIIEIGNRYNPQITEINKDYIREMLPYIETSGTLDNWSDIGTTLLFAIFTFLVFSSIESQFLYGSYSLLKKEDTDPVLDK